MKPAVALADLLAPGYFRGLLLALYGAELMPAQLPVLVSQWSKYYFAVLWPAALNGRAPSVIDEVGVELDERGLPLAFAPGSGDLQAVVEGHVRPLIQRLAALGEVPAAVLWGNAGDCLELLVNQYPSARFLLESPASPLFAAVRHAPDGRRVRRTCCLSYKVDWVGHCAHCPLLKR